jgi:predicted dehydrogenase
MLDLAIVGLGQWGRHLVRSAQGSDRLRFVVGVSVDPTGDAAFASEYGLELDTDYERVLANPRIRGVVLATPHSMHHEQICRAAAHGRHVFVEKPLALTARDAASAWQACRQAGVGLFVGYNWRFQPAVQELHRLVRSKAFGEIVHVEGNYSGPSGFRRARGSWRVLRHENPAGGMTGRGIHVANAMNLLCGRIISVFAHNDRRATPDDVEDTTSALVRFENGVTGYIGACQVTAEYWRLHVFGTKGWAEMRSEIHLVTCGIDAEPVSLTFPTIVAERVELDAFADAIERDSFCEQAVRDAVNGVALLEAIEASAAAGVQVKIPVD